jgi:hypothetical protein
MPDTGALASLEDLARQQIPAAARLGLAHAFAATFGALAVVMVISWAMLTRVESRPLRGRASAG